jgi:hypothetical protein
VRGDRTTTSVLGAVLVGVVACLLATACGRGGGTTTDVISAGQVDIQLPPGWKVTHDGAVAPAGGGGSSGAALPANEGPGTIPLAKQNPSTEFFTATSAFMSCLKGLGVTFVGAPNPKDPSSPANDPNYLKSLETCASQSHIVQALKDFQTSQNNLTPAQIQQENKSYLLWRTCMIGRGWTIPQPTPDSKGRLFALNTGGGGSGPQMTPPPGENAISSPDIQDCSNQVQQASPPAGQG